MEHMEIRPLLADLPLFQGLKEEYLDFLAECGSNEVFQAGKSIFHEGDHADFCYVLRSGRVAVETVVPGKAPLVIQTLDAGEVLGWSWIQSPFRWNFRGRTLELSRTLTLDAQKIRDRCSIDHDFGYFLLKRFTPIIVSRLQATRLQVMDIYAKD